MSTTGLAALVGTCIDAREVSYSSPDSMLYALSLGFGQDPLDPRALAFVREDGLKILPTLPLVLGYPGFFIQRPGVSLDWDRMLHAEERLVLHRALPPAGVVRDATWVDAVVDRGPDKGVFVHTRKELHSENDGLHLATVRSSILCRSEGGCGSAGSPPPPLHDESDALRSVLGSVVTVPQQALLYRLCGDTNPVHVSPVHAARAGFDRPLLHGRCTLGLALQVLLRELLAYEVGGISSISVRFAAPFFPGETLRVRARREGRRLWFAADAAERAQTVLSHGEVLLRNRAPD